MTDEGMHNSPSINLSDVLCFSLDYNQCQGRKETDSITSTAMMGITLAFAILHELIGLYWVQVIPTGVSFHFLVFTD